MLQMVFIIYLKASLHMSANGQHLYAWAMGQVYLCGSQENVWAAYLSRSLDAAHHVLHLLIVYQLK